MNYQYVTILGNSSETTSEQGEYVLDILLCQKNHPLWAPRISAWKGSLGVHQGICTRITTKYFGGILSVVALNIVTGPGAPVTGSRKAFQPGHKRNLCSPAIFMHSHTHTHILTFAVQGFIVDDRE